MQQIYSDIIQFRGSHYELGQIQGNQLSDSLIMKNRRRQWQLRRPRFDINVQETKDIFQKYAPAIREELIGMQDSLKQPMEEILRDFGGYRIEAPRSGCSTFTGKDFLVRNYDYHPKTYEGRFHVFAPSDSGYAVIGPAQRITGRMDGMNEKGLAMGYNSIHRKKPGSGFVCHMIGRMMLENCATTQEAEDFLKEIPHRHSFSYIVLDSNGETSIIEATPRSVEVRKGNACTNHFEILKEENRHYLDESHKRLNAIHEQQNDADNIHQAFHLLNDINKGVFATDYKSWSGTIHTSGYLPKEKKVWFALGGDQEPTVFDFGEWLNGEDYDSNRIYGEVDTDLGFAHMK
ncbi:acyl-CoA--6-aminopenicillanic acid acyltransferase [Oceanobacillus piezotolerans]|uniref:Acyl-CoA--6-aminopenicillanic acid acyltransferase n=1 Tax=Oceanobacillus piezotolerans TaxID=2448030 RepID=A0A498D5A8_9BACI|nr:C45 family peptidase [Oceanobacillus piezotolerans]RLL44908.1 acyl-CoA--6-aminopenicillanic acid acyltransferase [Oceanobacillus piezotolerans]